MLLNLFCETEAGVCNSLDEVNDAADVNARKSVEVDTGDCASDSGDGLTNKSRSDLLDVPLGVLDEVVLTELTDTLVEDADGDVEDLLDVVVDAEGVVRNDVELQSASCPFANFGTPRSLTMASTVSWTMFRTVSPASRAIGSLYSAMLKASRLATTASALG